MLSIIVFLLSLSYIDSASYGKYQDYNLDMKNNIFCHKNRFLQPIEPDDESDEMIALNDAFYTTPDGYIILKRGAVGGAVL